MHNAENRVPESSYTEANNHPSIYFNKDLNQKLVEYIPEPCFLILKNSNNRLIVNQQLVKLAGFHSLQDFYEETTGIDNLIAHKEIPKIMKDLEEVSKYVSIKYRRYNIIRKDGTCFKSTIYLKPLIDASTGIHYGSLGTIYENEKVKAYKIDRSILHIFNDDRFLDEVIVILDFKGNVLVCNKKFFIIDFFVDFTAKKLNLFNSIDPSYQKLLARRVAQLKKGISTPPTEYKLVAKNDRSAYIEVYSKTAIFKGRKAIVSLIRDISTRKEIEKKLLYAVVQTEEKERQRFAQDLHDELGPFLSGLKLYLHEMNAKDTDDARRKLLIDYLGQMTNEAVDKIRTISSNLMPQNMIELGLSGSLEKMIDKFNQAGRITINFKTEGSESGIEQSFIITLYRIVLELINNSLKHSGSDQIYIRIIFQKSNVKLNYEDNGKGFNLEKTISLNKGIGLKSILNRVEQFRGTYRFRKRLSGGIEFNFHFPLN